MMESNEEGRAGLAKEEQRQEAHFQEAVERQVQADDELMGEQHKHEEEVERLTQPKPRHNVQHGGSVASGLARKKKAYDAMDTSAGAETEAVAEQAVIPNAVDDEAMVDPGSPGTTVSYDTDLQGDADMGTFVGNWEVAISEVYSRPRVVPVAEQMGFKGGSSMDIVTQDELGRNWDFTKVEMRNHAYRRVMEEKPFLLVGSPCASIGVQL